MTWTYYSNVDVHFKCGIRQKWEICATFKMRCCCFNFVVSRKRDGKSNFHISFTPSLKSPTGTCEYLVLLWLCRKAYASYYLLACRFLRKPASFISFFLLGNVVGRVLLKFVSTNIFVFFWMIPTYHLLRFYFIFKPIRRSLKMFFYILFILYFFLYNDIVVYSC